MRTSLAISIALLLVAATAHAGTSAGVVLVTGKATAKERAVVASAVRSAARSGGWELVETPLSDAEVASVFACLRAPQIWSCVTPLVATKGIHRVIAVRVEPDKAPDGTAGLSVSEQVLLPGADAVTADKRPCPRCAEETLTRIAFDLTKTLIEEAASGTGQTKIHISSTPVGAWITLDNTNVGLTDHTYATYPGRHTVILQRDGYETETRTVDVAENAETTVAVTLRARGGTGPVGPPVPVAPDERSHLVPGLVIGAGAALVAGGIVLQAAKGAPDVGESQPSRLVSVPGVALIVGGSAAIGVGVYLWTQVTGRPAPTSTPTVTPTQGGGIVGWTGRF